MFHEGELTGNPLRHYRHFRRDPIGFLTSTRALGDIVRVPNVSGKTSYILHHPEFIRSVLAMEDERMIKGTSAKVLGLTVGEGLLTSEQDKHERQRRQIQPAFRSDMVAQVATTIRRLTDERISSWGEHSSLYVTRELLDLTLDIVFEGLFGIPVEEDREELHRVVEFAVEYSANRLMQSIPLPYWMPTARNQAHRRTVRKFDEIVNKLLSRAKDTSTGHVLAHILGLKDQEGNPASHQEIRDNIVTLIIAGHETTANLLNWMLYVIAQHPPVQNKLFAEIDSQLGGRDPNVENIRELPYLRQVVRETLRLYPPAWTIMRQNIAPVQLGDRLIPPNATFIIVPYVLHRDEHWFSNAANFIPERFSPNVEPSWPRFAYIPFGAGKRTCIGNRLAQTEIAIVMTRILQKYTWTVKYTDATPEPSVSLRLKGGVTAQFIQRL